MLCLWNKRVDVINDKPRNDKVRWTLKEIMFRRKRWKYITLHKCSATEDTGKSYGKTHLVYSLQNDFKLFTSVTKTTFETYIKKISPTKQKKSIFSKYATPLFTDRQNITVYCNYQCLCTQGVQTVNINLSSRQVYISSHKYRIFWTQNKSYLLPLKIYNSNKCEQLYSEICTNCLNNLKFWLLQ